MTGKLLSMAEAKDRIDAICLEIDGHPASAKTTSRHPFDECALPEWWLDRSGSLKITTRRVALLMAYVELGGEVFPMTGIPLADGYLRPDRTGMRALVLSNMVRLENASFQVTDKGRALLVPDRHSDPRTTALQPGAEKDGLAFAGGGEGENHRALRLWVLKNAQALLPELNNIEAQTEYVLPSADRIDVLVAGPNMRVALEVKSVDSNDADLARGIYQCVKYRAVLAAVTLDAEIKVRAMLITERPLPRQLTDEARRLDVANIVVPHFRGN